MKIIAYIFKTLFVIYVLSLILVSTKAFSQVFVTPDSWIEVLYQADQYPEEIEWKIEDVNGTTILESDTGVLLDDYELLEEYSEFVFSINNPYILTITDTYGDGLSGSQWNGEDGWFLIRNACQDTIAFVEGDFGSLYIDSLTIAPCAPPIYGCLDPVAVNYNPSAYFDDECIWPDCSGFNSVNASQQCNGNQTELIFEWLTNGIGPSCDVNQIHYGYDLEATPFVQSQFFQAGVPVGATPPTTFPYTIWEVSYFNNNNNVIALKAGGNFVTEEIPHFFFVKFESGNYSDTIWITPEACIVGCMDETSPLYNPMATMDDGSCNVTAACGPNETNISVMVTPDSYPGETSWEIVDTLSENVIATSPNYNQTGIPVTTSICLDTTMALEFRLLDQFGDGLCGSCYGGVDGEVLVINPLCGDTIFYLAAPNTNFGYEIEQNFVLSFCPPPSPPSGCTNPSYVEFDPMAVVDDSSCVTPVILGCIDSTMFNYDSLANQQQIIPGCDYTLKLTDGPGDGWFGSYITLVQGGNTYGPYTIHEGFVLDTLVSLSAMEPVKIYFYTQGNSITTANQCGIQLIDPFGNVTFSIGGSPWSPILTYPFKYTTLLDCGNNCIEKVYGCIDPLAVNYDSSANTTDGSCYYNPGCTNPIYLEYDASYDYDDGSCSTLIVLGCMDPTALNYDSLANVELVGSCIEVVEGCMNALAFNYNPNANVDDNSCIPVIEGCTNPLALNFDSTANTDDNTCVLPIPGCTDPNAFNYDASANVDDSSCVAIIYGCMDITMWNYNVLANTDNGSCIAFAYGCMDSTAYNYDPVANVDNGSCIPYIYGCTDPIALNYNSNANTDDFSCILPIYGCMDSTAFNYDELANVDNGSCIPVVLGCINPIALNYCDSCNTDDFSCILPIYGCTDSTMFNYNPLANVDNNTCVPYVYGCTDPSMLNFNPQANTEDFSCIPYIYGCTDSTALNYDSLANTENGSCIEIIIGCMDQNAWNYNDIANVNDSISCLYDAGCITGAGNPYWLNDECYAWVISVDDYCCDNEWDNVCQLTYDYCQDGWSGPQPPARFGEEIIMLYPNPTTGVVNITETVDIIIRDNLGKEILNLKDVNQIDLSKYNKGIYNFTIKYQNKIVNYNIVKY